MDLFLYTSIPILIILLAVLLFRGARAPQPSGLRSENEVVHDLRDGTWLLLSERIFDRGDYVWIRDELGFPGIARDLASSRQGLAVQWLQGLKASFKDMVRTPDPASLDAPASPAPDSWRLLWLTLRIHFLLNYALFVVRVFGPYHRLIPLNWGSLVAHFRERPAPFRTSPSPPLR